MKYRGYKLRDARNAARGVQAGQRDMIVWRVPGGYVIFARYSYASENPSIAVFEQDTQAECIGYYAPGVGINDILEDMGEPVSKWRKFSPEIVREAHRLHRKGLGSERIANRLNVVNRPTVQSWLSGRARRDIWAEFHEEAA